MADNFLEKHYEEYEAKKAEWLRKKKKYISKTTLPQRQVKKPEDESL